MTDRTFRLTQTAKVAVEDVSVDSERSYILGFVEGGTYEAERYEETREELLDLLEKEGTGDDLRLKIRKLDEEWLCYVDGRVQGVVSDTLDEAILGALLQDEDADPTAATCSFCKKNRQAVKRMEGPDNVRICDECIAVVQNVVADQKPGPRPVPSSFSVLTGREPYPCPTCKKNMKPHKGLPPGLLCDCGYQISYDDIEIRQLLKSAGFDDVAASKWLVTPHQDLGGDTPTQVAQRGDIARLRELLLSLGPAKTGPDTP